MAHTDYYTFEQGSVNGKIMMNVQVFDMITKKTVSGIKNVSIDTSKGFSIPGTKAVVSCSIKDNEVFVNIHVRIKYGVSISKTTKEIQEKIALAIKEMTDVTVKHINIVVDDVDFE